MRTTGGRGWDTFLHATKALLIFVGFGEQRAKILEVVPRLQPLITRRKVSPRRSIGDKEDFFLACSLTARVFLEISHGEERTPCVHPAYRLLDRTRFAVAKIEPVVAVIGVGLQYPGITGQMRLRMPAPAVARVVEHRRGRPRAAEGLVVAT